MYFQVLMINTCWNYLARFEHEYRTVSREIKRVNPVTLFVCFLIAKKATTEIVISVEIILCYFEIAGHKAIRISVFI